MGELSEQRASIFGKRPPPRTCSVIAPVAVPKALNMDLKHLTKLSSLLRVFQPFRRRCKAVLHHAKNRQPRLRRLGLEPCHRTRSQPHRLFDNHMATCVDRLARQIHMAAIGRRDRHHIHLHGIEHRRQGIERLGVGCP